MGELIIRHLSLRSIICPNHLMVRRDITLVPDMHWDLADFMVIILVAGLVKFQIRSIACLLHGC